MYMYIGVAFCRGHVEGKKRFSFQYDFASSKWQAVNFSVKDFIFGVKVCTANYERKEIIKKNVEEPKCCVAVPLTIGKLLHFFL